MFRPFRLVMIVALVIGIYATFFTTPSNPHTPNAFDPERVAAFELESWKSAVDQSELGVFTNLVQMLHEQHRYTWWKAGLAGFYLSRATTRFAEMHNRFERALPDLEDVAAVEKGWMEAKFDPAAVARANLDWWVTRRLPGLDTADHVAELMAKDYALRYGVGESRVIGAATLRAQALQLRDEGGSKPNWTAISRLLVESYKSLRAGVAKTRS